MTNGVGLFIDKICTLLGFLRNQNAAMQNFDNLYPISPALHFCKEIKIIVM